MALLLTQADTVESFFLYLAEKTSLKAPHALLLACVGTASSLKVHLRSVTRASCSNNEQMAQVERAMRILYCIEKSYALRWQMFPFFSKEFLLSLNPTNDPPLADNAPAISLELLHIRVQYAHICLQIAQLRKAVDETASTCLLGNITQLATALDGWHESTKANPILSSLGEDAIRRSRHQAFCHYNEALLHLGSICPPEQHSPVEPLYQELEVIRRRSIREVVTSCSAISGNNSLEDQ
ncbi:hypothetical protein TW65_09325 [Stemphylium lycopersici]|uniref:Uncharacterized protein n=1 Tax=Stemphylium lycopersici TaxID=183478 RepID=A0A364MS53_STELY|nr:hypothetical protein TW65_09325 [Stemphylium lycopersici]RAQ99827.1 hypothetical protein DDE83_009175 [Stemphylium lycopersici]